MAAAPVIKIIQEGAGKYRAVYKGHSYRVRQDGDKYYITVKGTRLSCTRYVRKIGGTSSRLLNLSDELLEKIIHCMDKSELEKPYTACRKLKDVSTKALHAAQDKLGAILNETDIDIFRRDSLPQIQASKLLKDFVKKHIHYLLTHVYHGAHLYQQPITKAACRDACEQHYYPVFLKAILFLLGDETHRPSYQQLPAAKLNYDACILSCETDDGLLG
jgi:hypothetical protein